MDLSCSAHEAQVPVARTSDYTISLEQINPQTTFVHCTILVPWTGRVRRNLQRDWQTILRLHGGPIYARFPDDDPKLKRFAVLMGAEHVATLTDLTSGQSDLIFEAKIPHDGQAIQTRQSQDRIHV